MEQYIIFIIWLTIFAIISYRRLDSGICLVVFTLPCYLLRPQIFGIPTTILELEIYILFSVWLIKNLRPKFENRVLTIGGDRPRLSEALGTLGILKNQGFFIPLILILMGAVLSTIFSSDLRISLGILKGWFFDPLVFGFVVLNTLKTKEQIKNLLSWLAASGITVAIVSFFYYFSGHLTFDGRLRAFYLSPNHLAMYLVPCLLSAYYLLFVASNKIFKYWWFFGLILMALSVYLTFSYSTWLGILSGLLFFDFFIFEKRKRIFSLLCLAILTIFLLYFQMDSLKFRGLVESPRSSFQSRIMVWQSASKIIKDHPILGIGPGMFQEYYLKYQKYFPPYLEWAAPQPHNLFLAFWLQCGILGLVGFFWLLIWFFKTGLSKLTTNNYQLTTILMSIMVCTLVHGLVDTTYWKNDISIIFWLIISLMAVLVAKPSYLERGSRDRIASENRLFGGFLIEWK